MDYIGVREQELLYQIKNLLRETGRTSDGILYHYCTEKTLRLILKDNTLLFNHISKLNEPCENRLFYQKFIGTKWKLYNLDSSFAINFETALKELLEDRFWEKEDVYMLCFSNIGDNWANWNIFSRDNDNYGCNIGFERAKLERVMERVFRRGGINYFISNVIYDDEIKKNKLYDILKSVYDKWIISERTDKEKDILIDSFKYIISVINPLFKDKYYAQENEVRVIADLRYHRDQIEGFKLTKTEEKNHFKINFDISCLKSIGCTSLDTIKNISTEHGGYRNFIRASHYMNDKSDIINNMDIRWL